MSRAHRMQELEYFRGGAARVISVEGSKWFSTRKCSDKGKKKRDEELQFWISPGHMLLSDEKQQPITCFCILDQRGSADPDLWRSADLRTSLVTWPPSQTVLPQHCRLLEEPVQRQQEAPWSRLVINMQDIFPLITKNVNLPTQQCAATTKERPERFIIFCGENIPAPLFTDVHYTQDFRTVTESTGCQIVDNNNVSSDSTAHSPSDPNNNYEDDQNETVTGDNFNLHARKSLLKSCQNNNCPADSSRRDRNLRKSVSFDDDVTVYLFDQETPTVALHSEPCASLPSSSSCTLPDVTLDDSGLEWEDDFSTLEKNCHYQCVSRSRHHSFSLPTQSWAAQSRPERYSLSQNCLFLTHVTESDLEL